MPKNSLVIAFDCIAFEHEPWELCLQGLTKDDESKYGDVQWNRGINYSSSMTNNNLKWECIERMHKVEEDIKRNGCCKGPSDTLKTEINYWLRNVKKNQLKAQSYNRLETTIRTIINPWGAVNKKAYLVRPQELQEFINGMNDGDHSHSTIKKVFDCLNEFYRYLSRRDHFNNPMETVVCVSKNNVVKERKEVEYLDSEDIRKFKAQAVATWESTGKQR